jgi:UDP-N-acetylmuramate dehydrogenase
MLIQKNKSLRDYNSFHFDVEAKYFVSIQSVADIQALIQDPVFSDNKRLIVGGGSNMLLTQEYFDGLVIHNAIMGKEIMYEDDSSVVLRVWAGEVWHDLVIRTVNQWRWWLENLALIPGSVGAAPMQNIGAYGVEVKDVIEFVEYVDLSDGSMHVLDTGSCAFGYRDSVFKRDLKDRAFISSVVIRLHKADYVLKLAYKDIEQEIAARWLDKNHISVIDVADMVTAIRRRKLPDWTQIGTAGSFFKNPIVDTAEFQRLKVLEPLLVGYEVAGGMKLSAGQLIELAGLKW